jgi:preprotein translocase subunit Sss1
MATAVSAWTDSGKPLLTMAKKPGREEAAAHSRATTSRAKVTGPGRLST